MAAVCARPSKLTITGGIPGRYTPMVLRNPLRPEYTLGLPWPLVLERKTTKSNPVCLHDQVTREGRAHKKPKFLRASKSPKLPSPIAASSVSYKGLRPHWRKSSGPRYPLTLS